MRIPVLNDGFVEYIDSMGDDHAIVQAARTSFIGRKNDIDTSKDEQLIRYLLRLGHTSPFEMCILKIGIRIPMDAWRQFIRHRTLSVNEYSTRYAPAIDSCQKVTQWRVQATDNKQGSDGIIEDKPTAEYLSSEESILQLRARKVYEERIQLGIAREQARKDLLLSTYTEAMVECDLHNWMHFLKLRLDKHAQQEIRQYAEAIGNLIAKRWPITWQAFKDYKLNAVTFTACDLEAFQNHDYVFPTKREEKEYIAKLGRLGL